MTSPKTRTVLSRDAVVAETVVALDEIGVDRLSVRELARRLNAGVASMYWYVKSKDELIDLAVDQIMASVVEPVVERAVDRDGRPRRRSDGAAAPVDPLDTLHALTMRLFDAFDAHQWCPGRVSQNPERQPHTVAVLDLVGQQLARLGLTIEQQFHAATSIMSFVIGSCSQTATAQRRVGNDVTRGSYLSDTARDWSEVDPKALPFLRSASKVVRDHDDREQFEFGVDLLLAGVRGLSSSR